MRFDNRALKEAARKSLARSSCDHRRLVLIHTGVVCLANILISLLVFYLNRQIEDTGGIGGLDRRNLLSTVTTVAQLAQTVLLLFWGFGYTSVSIDLARDHIPERDCLLDGFRLVGPILRLTLLKGLLMGGTLFFSIQVASFFFCMTPWADPLMDFTVIYLESTDYAAMEAALIAVLEQIQLPMMGITALVFLVLSVPALCRFRFADLILMDDPSVGAMKAVTGSARLLRHRCGALLRLDLHFWWYHLPYFLLMLLGNVSFLSSYFGFTIPFDSEITSLICTVTASVGLFLLSLWRKSLVRLTYVNAYDLLLDPPEKFRSQL
jgi:uncharacterized membrane protein